MPPNRPLSNFSKRPTRRVRLPKIGQRKTKGFFEEYFYGCLAAIFLAFTILMKASGMSTYNAFVLGLWVTGFTWFARLAKQYFQEGSKPEMKKKAKAAVKTQPQNGRGQLAPGMKPIIGPQWPLKSPQPLPQASQGPPAPAPGNKQKPAFVYERPTLPDRKPKFPANWPSAQDKKPKR
jgi:hypothetical protein